MNSFSYGSSSGQFQSGSPGFEYRITSKNENLSYKHPVQTPSHHSKAKPSSSLNKQNTRSSISPHGRPVKLKPLPERSKTFIIKELKPGELQERFTTSSTPPNEYLNSQQNLVPCSICGRNFAAERLNKHMGICAKASNKKRRQFDSTRARTQGTEFAQFNRSGKRNIELPKPKNHWKQKHGNVLQLKCN